MASEPASSSSHETPEVMQTRLATMLSYPFGCAQLSEAYAQVLRRPAPSPHRSQCSRSSASRLLAQCLSQHGHWSKCQASRDALDACVEVGEKARFRLETQCRRWKRLFQSCLLQGTSDDNYAIRYAVYRPRLR